MTHNPALDLAPFGRWTLRDKAAQRRLALTWTPPSHVGWARFCAHADSSFWSRQLCHVIAAQTLQAQAISLRWSLTGGSRFYVTKRFATHCAPHSTFHRHVRDGVYAHDWAVAMESAVLGYDYRCPRGHKDVPTLLD